MKTEKIVYIPEVVYQQKNTNKKSQDITTTNNKINQKAALIAATLLALSASGQAKVNTDTINPTEKRANVIVLSPKNHSNTNTFTISESSLENIPKPQDKKNNVPILPVIGLWLTLTGLAYSTAALFNMQELIKIKNKHIKNLETENNKIKQENDLLQTKFSNLQEDYNNFKESHPGLGVMSQKRMDKLRQKVLDYDFSNGDTDGRN